ncbi:MAG: SCP2 sterol-binding domain-containing protein [Rubellimicrobium sp.]|nr:SCP2 sterol-binding domain-containing protein [Rubellimicrobium sp.]
MSEIMTQAATMMRERTEGRDFDGSAKFVFEGEGAMMIDAAGVRLADEEAAVTLTASPETFRAIFEGALHPTSAFMSGKLSISGDMGMALRLSSILA